MCLNPRIIYNPSRHVSYLSHRLHLTVACGKCSECRKQKELEWQHRAYSEYKHYSQNGIVLFQTLTYNEKEVPRVHTIGDRVLSRPLRIFSRQDIKEFRSRLRDRIRHYAKPDGTKPFFDYYCNDNFKLIITSEYGGITHRPHYHCLFFSSIPGLSANLLDYFIRKSWYKGIVDRSPVERRKVNGTGVLSYVSKYMCKDDYFSHFLEHELSSSYESPRTSSVTMNDVLPFHVQSQHFGQRIIDQVGIDNLFKSGYIDMPDKQRVVSSIPIPMYIQRHLFYDLVDDVHNIDPRTNKPRKRWLLNKLGIKFKMLHLDEKLDKFATTLYNNIHNITSLVDCSFRSLVNEVLNGRSLRDYAVYSLIFRGCHGDSRFSSYRHAYRCLLSSSSYASFLSSKVDIKKLQLPPLVYSFAHPVDTTCNIFDDFPYLDSLFSRFTSKLNEYKLNKYYSIMRDKSRLKLLNESYLINPQYLNSISYEKTDRITAV